MILKRVLNRQSLAIVASSTAVEQYLRIFMRLYSNKVTPQAVIFLKLLLVASFSFPIRRVTTVICLDSSQMSKVES